MKTPRRLFALVLALTASAGCRPKYGRYASLQGDFICMAPWGWEVLTDHDGQIYTDVTFIGPFNPAFYLGAPSLQIRWHAYSTLHQLRDGSYELYTDANDYIAQTLHEVYGPDYRLVGAAREIWVAGRKAENFTVLSPARPEPGARWGLMRDDANRLIDPRQHAYVVLPLATGFYVFIYPATKQGYPLYLPQFNELVNSFSLLKEGPGGPALDSSSPFSQASQF